MIALLMVYVLAVGALIALLARLLEQVARARRWPTRAVWAAAMSAMLALGIGVAFPDVWTERDAYSAADGSSQALSPVVVQAPAAAATIAPGSLERAWERGIRVLGIVEAQIVARRLRSTDLDQVLLSAWALLTAFLAGIVAHAAFEGRRLRQGLEEREVEGTPVLVTEGVGPVAVGTGPPAILLPRWVLELDGALLTLVLRHEREHLRARDPLLLLGGLLAIVLVPWLLPLWWSWGRLRLATEVDCDTRVLRACPDVRRYGHLLLLTSQRVAHTPWVSRPVVTVVAPLQPRSSHLAERIHAMTQPHTARSLARTVVLLGGIALTATAALALPTPQLAVDSARGHAGAIVHLSSVGLEGTEVVGDSLPYPILVYTTGVARVGIGTADPTVLTDTLRLYRLPSITADVTDGEVHLQLMGAGRMVVGGEVTGGPTKTLSASGQHIVLLQGGVGVKPAP